MTSDSDISRATETVTSGGIIACPIHGPQQSLPCTWCVTEKNMRDSLSSTERIFRVFAVIKYTRLVGIFKASSKEEAEHLACRSHIYERLASASPGGVYDLEVEEVS